MNTSRTAIFKPMSDTTLGHLIYGDSQRDAIHVAIAPVVANVGLEPGNHVGLMPDGTACVSAEPHIGIVDPFLTKRVKRGEKFWLCLYQKTVTGMRHHWSHPAFTEEVSTGIKSQAETYIRKVCAEYSIDFEYLVAKFATESYYCHGDDSHPGEDYEKAEKLIGALTQYTGKSKPGFYFRCAC